MFAPLCTTAQSNMRHMRIKTQNMIVFTLEFTNDSFFAAKEIQLPRPPPNPARSTHFYRRQYTTQSGKKYTTPFGPTRISCRLRSSKQIVLPRPGKLE